MSLWPFQRCEKSATLSPESRRGCLLFNLYNSLSILSDIHSAAKSVWQGLGQRAHLQWPLTLVCPDTCDECLQDTEGGQPAMSGFYYVPQRLGTVSLIKQIILEGKATGKRRRKTGGENVSLPLILIKKKNSKISTHPTHSVVCVCVCVITQPPLSRLENILPFLPFHLSPQGPVFALRRLKNKQWWWNRWMLRVSPLRMYVFGQVPPHNYILLQLSWQGEARPFGVRFLYWDGFYQSKVSTRLSWRTLSTAAPTIASESWPETLEAFCFFPVACPKAWPSLPLPAAGIVLHSRDLIDCCHLMLKRYSRVHSADCWVLLKET